METKGKPTNAEAGSVFKLAAGLGGVTVTFLDANGQPGPQQRLGSVTFPSQKNADGDDKFTYTPHEMALTIWNVSWALLAAPLKRSGFNFVFSREDETTPTEYAKDPDQGQYLPIMVAYDDLMEIRLDDQDAVDISPFPTVAPTVHAPLWETDRRRRLHST
jgi:hypothetical protein